MSARDILHSYQLAEARGHIPEGSANRLTLQTILLAGAAAHARAYYGEQVIYKAMEDARALSHEAKEMAMVTAESLITDLSVARRAGRQAEAMTSSDFPLALAQIRDRVRRGSYNPVESEIFKIATPRRANDFKRIRGIRTDAFSRLKLRPEGTNVEYANFGSNEDGYQIANYELALAYTREAWYNDDIDEFVTAAANLGVAGRRNRALVVIEAIKGALTRTVIGGSVGGPDAARLEALFQAFAEQTNADGKPMPRLLTDIVYPAAWAMTAKAALESDLVVTGSATKTPNRNVAKGIAVPHLDAMLAEVGTAKDWLGFDGRQSWLEFATLRGYEAGPKTFTKMPDVVETDMEGSFENGTIALKVSDNVGASVTDSKSAILVQGQ